MEDVSVRNNDEKVTVARNMVNHGGSFVRALGHALFYADEDHARRIRHTWPEYWQRYLTIEKEVENRCKKSGSPQEKPQT